MIGERPEALVVRPDQDTPQSIRALAESRWPEEDFRKDPSGSLLIEEKNAMKNLREAEAIKIALGCMIEKSEEPTYEAIGRRIYGAENLSSDLAVKVRKFVAEHPHLRAIITQAKALVIEIQQKTTAMQAAEGIGPSKSELTDAWHALDPGRRGSEEKRRLATLGVLFRASWEVREKLGKSEISIAELTRGVQEIVGNDFHDRRLSHLLEDHPKLRPLLGLKPAETRKRERQDPIFEEVSSRITRGVRILAGSQSSGKVTIADLVAGIPDFKNDTRVAMSFLQKHDDLALEILPPDELEKLGPPPRAQ